MFQGRVGRIRRAVRLLVPGIRRKLLDHGFKSNGFKFGPANKTVKIINNDVVVLRIDLKEITKGKEFDWLLWNNLIEEAIEKKVKGQHLHTMLTTMNNVENKFGIESWAVHHDPKTDSFIVKAYVNNTACTVDIKYGHVCCIDIVLLDEFVYWNIMAKYYHITGQPEEVYKAVDKINLIKTPKKTWIEGIKGKAYLFQPYKEDWEHYAKKQAAYQQHYESQLFQQQLKDPDYQTPEGMTFQQMAFYAKQIYPGSIVYYDDIPDGHNQYVQPAPPGMWLTPNVTVEDVT